MLQPRAIKEMLTLFEELVGTLVQSKKIKRDQISTNLFYELQKMTTNNRSKFFINSAIWIDPELAENLVQQDLIQKFETEDTEKYTLTFQGIVQCIQMNYDKTLNVQFSEFLKQIDSKFISKGQIKLDWKEKLASLSLILMISTSNSSAIRLDIKANKTVLTEVFKETLECLKKFDLIKKERKLPKISRGEDPISAIMSRLSTLTRKTNQYYKFEHKKPLYFFDIEKKDNIDEKRLFFLFRRIFAHYNPKCDYREMNKILTQISQIYYPRFLARTVHPTIAFNIIKGLKTFMDTEILRLSVVMIKK